MQSIGKNFQAKRPECGLAVTVIATSLGFVLVQLDVSIVNVALAKMGATLATGVGGLQWVVDSYALAFASLLLSAGALGDRIGPHRAFSTGFALFTLASLGCGAAPNLAGLIVARTMQGGGASLLVPCSLALLSHACRGNARQRAKAVSLWTAAGSIGLAAGPILGGFLVDFVGWRSIFLVNLPIGAAGIWLTERFVARPAAHGGKFDPAGQTLSILMLLGLTAGVIEAGALGWSAPLPLAAFALALVSGTAFLWAEARQAAPMLPLPLFRNSTFSSVTFIGFLLNLTLYGIIFVVGLYLQQVRGLSPTASGLVFLPFSIVLGLANIASGRLAAKAGPRTLMAVGLATGAAGYWMLRGLDASTPYPIVLVGLSVIAAGGGLAVPAMTTALLGTVPQSRSGLAAGVLNSVRQAGGAIGVALFGALMADDAVRGIDQAFAIAATLRVAAVLVASFGIRQLVVSSPRMRRML
jgi:DHA2 family methylenomycin A resistance protein-like MFS transporter